MTRCKMLLLNPSGSIHIYNYWTAQFNHYQHRHLKFFFLCGEGFPFWIQLKRHSLVHRRYTTYCCVYPNCNKLFKNKGDFIQHSKEHTSKKHQCPDCDYSNSDIRNLESHLMISMLQTFPHLTLIVNFNYFLPNPIHLCGILDGLSLHLNNLIASCMTNYNWPFGTLPFGLY